MTPKPDNLPAPEAMNLSTLLREVARLLHNSGGAERGAGYSAELANAALRWAENVPQWRPIESAPRDGTVFIGRNADHPNWGSYAMMRHVLWCYSEDALDFVCDDLGAWIMVRDHEPDREEGNTSGRTPHVPSAIAPDK